MTIKSSKKEIKTTFACPSCSSKREKDSEECPRCRSSLSAVQIYPAPTIVLSKEEAKQILVAKSMTSGISRLHKGRHSNLVYEEDFILSF